MQAQAQQLSAIVSTFKVARDVQYQPSRRGGAAQAKALQMAPEFQLHA
jgi:hypothetical protein